MPPEQVLDVIKEKSGVFFDGKIVDAFIRYYRDQFLNVCQLRVSSG